MAQPEYQPLTIFVGNIDYKAKANDFVDAFKSFGEINKARIVTTKFRGREISRGLAMSHLRLKKPMKLP